MHAWEHIFAGKENLTWQNGGKRLIVFGREDGMAKALSQNSYNER